MRQFLYFVALFGVLGLGYRIVLPILIESWRDLGDEGDEGDE